jgi:hypothetical protein
VPPLVDLKGVVLPAARVGGPYPGRYSEKLRGGSGTVAQVK